MVDDGLLFSQLLLRHERALFRYIMMFVHRRDDAEEVLQRTATSLWQKFNEYDRSREFLPWAFRFTYFEILTYCKEEKRIQTLFRTEVLDSLDTARHQMGSILEAQHVALQECLKEIGSESLELLQRHYGDSKSVVELAEETGKTVKSLYRKLDRVRERLATCITRKLAHEEL